MSDNFNFDIEIDMDQVIEMMSSGRDAISKALEYTATGVWSEVQKEAPVDHGRLAGSFNIEGSDLSWRIYSNVEYALAVHEGTGIYGPTGQQIVIEAAPGSALYWPGAAHPVKRVVQDGQPGRPYADKALATIEGRTQEFIDRAIRETVGGI